MKSYQMICIRSYEKNCHLRKWDAKKISWKCLKSFKHIEKVNKILLQYYLNIFQSSFEFEIFKRNTPLFCAPQNSPSFRRHKRCIGCYTISCNWPGCCTQLEHISIVSFPEILHISNNKSMYRIHSVFAK